jgi:hypothetical protein
VSRDPEGRSRLSPRPTVTVDEDQGPTFEDGEAFKEVGEGVPGLVPREGLVESRLVDTLKTHGLASTLVSPRGLGLDETVDSVPYPLVSVEAFVEGLRDR